MKFLVITNGAYGNLDWYRSRVGLFERLICVDGGAGRARELGIIPHWIVGDMDSISEPDRKFMEDAGVCFEVHPPEKDFTDTQLALELAAREGGRNIVVWGGTGSRLDHNLSNIFSASFFLERGIDIVFDSPDMTVYLVKKQLVIPGSPGDTVSLIAMGSRVSGVDLHGFKYPLNKATLEGNWQWAVSNIITQAEPVVRLDSGILAVFHYKTPVP
ncbi:thiamine diphosphokinase [Pelotomaculum propionicicum]|uniref:Thiamine diphosphokinase n=1 Tax=Pelotomaculum propionicicum TaxID=258475 RepID=A0A4Y7RT60_9FIRM|nr:thiamine diphosphokinase [Pelotomaculum propionicicum]NLI13033.1 thiamine diphosphokinase [Peptococcaceae bacterium]TEB11919.1 Thiamine pyrophosphokinase [Pelotomaculum propionicicum]